MGYWQNDPKPLKKVLTVEYLVLQISERAAHYGRLSLQDDSKNALTLLSRSKTYVFKKDSLKIKE